MTIHVNVNLGEYKSLMWDEEAGGLVWAFRNTVEDFAGRGRFVGHLDAWPAPSVAGSASSPKFSEEQWATLEQTIADNS